MSVLRIVPATGRRLVMAAGVALAILASTAAPALAQDPPPAAPAQEAPDPMKFTHDRILLYFLIADSGVAIFEDILAKTKAILDKSEKPERKQQATSYKVSKVEGPGQPGIVTYFAVLEPVIKEASYDPFKILAEGMPPDEVRALYDKFIPHLKGISASPFRPIMGGSQ